MHLSGANSGRSTSRACCRTPSPHATARSLHCSHLCLQYVLPTDTVTNVSTLKISDQRADWDPDNLTAPVVEPVWDMGDVSVDTQEMISALISRYGTETSASVFVEDTTSTDHDDFWTDVYDDSESVNPTQAGSRASAIVGNRKWGHPTVPLTIIIRDDQAHLIGAGSLVQIKSVIAAGGTYLGTYVNRRVANAIFEPLSPEKMVRLAGTLTYGYRVHLDLDRPPKRTRTRKGKLAPQATTPQSATEMPYDPSTSGLSATDVQDAIDELAAAIAALGPSDGDAYNLGSTLSGAVSVDRANGTWQYGTLTGNIAPTFAAVTSGKDIGLTLELTEDGTGGHTIDWSGITIVWLGGSEPTHDTTAGTTTIYGFLTRDGGTTWIGGVSEARAALPRPCRTL